MKGIFISTFLLVLLVFVNLSKSQYGRGRGGYDRGGYYGGNYGYNDNNGYGQYNGRNDDDFYVRSPLGNGGFDFGR